VAEQRTGITTPWMVNSVVPLKLPKLFVLFVVVADIHGGLHRLQNEICVMLIFEAYGKRSIYAGSRMLSHNTYNQVC